MMNKTLKAVCLYIAVFASALMIVVLAVTAANRSATAVVPAAAINAEGEKSYIIRAYNGHIAVFLGADTDSAVIETTIEVEGLRAVDKDKLGQGIVAHSYEEVLKLLEDFGS